MSQQEDNFIRDLVDKYQDSAFREQIHFQMVFVQSNSFIIQLKKGNKSINHHKKEAETNKKLTHYFKGKC